MKIVKSIIMKENNDMIKFLEYLSGLRVWIRFCHLPEIRLYLKEREILGKV